MPEFFADILKANADYAASFSQSGLTGRAARELAVLTCIDSRIEPLAMLGLAAGDAKIIRNAGARVTNDALRSLVLATNLLAARRVMIVAHTDCAMSRTTDAELRAGFTDRYPDAQLDSVNFYAITDPYETLKSDVQRLRNSGLIPSDTVIGGFEYDVHTGMLRPVVTG